MTAVSSVDSFKYGTRLFAYLLVVLVVGGGFVGLGASVGYGDATSFLDDGAYNTSELVAGAVLAVLGSFVLLSGWFGLVYKLVADSVAAGTVETAGSTVPSETGEVEKESEPKPDTAAASETVATTTEPEPTTRTDESVGPVGESDRSAAADQRPTSTDTPAGPTAPTEEETAEETATGDANAEPEGWEDETETPARDDEPDTERRAGEESRPEPSPGEIAFGSSDDEEPDTERAEPEDDEPVEPAGDGTSGDPLADPTDEE